MTLKEQIMKLQTYKMYEGEDTVYVERDEVLKLLEQQPSREYISRFDVLNLFNYGKLDEDIVYSADVMNAVRALPAVTPKILEPCEDCISRQAVLDEINRIGDTAFDGYNDYSDFFEFIDNLPSVTPKVKWIPVAERLPEKSGKYLVTVKNGNVYAGTYDAFSGKFQCAATAWQPLPTPYKP